MKGFYELIFEDEHLIVINKAPGVLTLPDRYFPEKTNLFDLLNRKYGRIFTVHRLDKETSGLLVFARDEASHRHLSLQFQNRQVEKKYLALVDGVIDADQGSIDKPIAPHSAHPERMVISQRGKPSLTTFTVLERFKTFTLVEASIKTGRTHQIRVHFQSVGHPLAVDVIYGTREAIYLSNYKRHFNLGRNEEERPLMSRVPLHAHYIAFEHPASGQWAEFNAEPPKDFRALLNQLRKWSK